MDYRYVEGDAIMVECDQGTKGVFKLPDIVESQPMRTLKSI